MPIVNGVKIKRSIYKGKKINLIALDRNLFKLKEIEKHSAEQLLIFIFFNKVHTRSYSSATSYATFGIRSLA